jgi:hypothetical protein
VFILDYLVAFANVRTDDHIINLRDVFAVFQQHEAVIVDAAGWVLPEVDGEQLFALLHQFPHCL